MDTILKVVNIDKCELRLVEKVSKSGNLYKACVIVVDNIEKVIGFEIDFYSLRKKLKGGN